MYSERLRELREEKCLKQHELSEKFNFSKEVYGNFERENTIMPIKYLIRVCDYFNCSLDYIFGLSDVRKYLNSKADMNFELMRERLRELRKENSLTQRQLANQLSIAPSTLGDYERKAKIITTPFLYDICKKYHISADYLLGRIDNPKYLSY